MGAWGGGGFENDAALDFALTIEGLTDIAPEELTMIEVSHTTDIVNAMHRGFWCHLRCLNVSLHPAHIVQNWKFGPDKL